MSTPANKDANKDTKPFSLEEETPLAYFQKLIDFIYDPFYARFLRRISARYDRSLIPEDLDLQPFLIDGLIFETFIDKKTPLDRFIEQYQSQMTSAQRKVYQRFRSSTLGCYEIVERFKPDKILLKDLLDDSTLEVRDSDAWRFLMPGFYSICRVLPFEDHHVLTGSCAILNYKDPQQVIALTREFKLPPLFVDGF